MGREREWVGTLRLCEIDDAGAGAMTAHFVLDAPDLDPIEVPKGPVVQHLQQEPSGTGVRTDTAKREGGKAGKRERGTGVAGGGTRGSGHAIIEPSPSDNLHSGLAE